MAIYFNGFQWLNDLYRLALPIRAPLPLPDPLHHIVQGFKNGIDRHQPAFTTPEIAERVHLLSERKQLYYAQGKWGSFIKIISMVRNYWRFGCLKSSAELGLEWSRPYQRPPEVRPEDSGLSDQVMTDEEEDDEEEEEFFDALENFEENNPVEIKPPQAQVILSPKEQLLDTVFNIWGIAYPEERCYIQTIFHYIFFRANIIEFKRGDDKKTFHLVLEQEVRGEVKGLTVPAKAILKQNMTVVFSEDEWGKKTFTFPGNCFAMRVGYGLLSKDAYLNKVEVDGEQVTVQVNAFGKIVTQFFGILQCIELWKVIPWE